MNNKGLLVIIIILLVGVIAIVAMETTKKSPGEQLAEDFGEFTEEMSDEIDDATTR